MSRRRILFIAEAVTLAHVVRLVALARSLDPVEWDIGFAADPRYAPAIGPLPFPVEPIWTIAPERFARAIARGSPIYNAASLDHYVEDDLRLITRFRPDVVVGDFRISLGISARVAKVLYVNVANAYWSPYAKIRHVVPEITAARVLPLALAQPLFELFRRTGYAVHAMPVNMIRRKHGLAPLPLDFRWALVEGDATLYADLPEVIPTLRLPASHKFVGPIPWSPSLPLPDWWPEIGAAAAIQPVVYVNLGSSGVRGGLARVLEALRSLPVNVIAATAGHRDTLPATHNSRVTEYLPGDACAQVASVVICNGGSPATYQALAEGKPVIGLAANMDQFLNMAAVQDASCGRLLRACSCSEVDIRLAVVDVLSNPRYGESLLRVKRAIANCDAFARFRRTLRDLTGAAPV